MGALQQRRLIMKMLFRKMMISAFFLCLSIAVGGVASGKTTWVKVPKVIIELPVAFSATIAPPNTKPF
jgi:hypothetical protein